MLTMRGCVERRLVCPLYIISHQCTSTRSGAGGGLSGGVLDPSLDLLDIRYDISSVCPPRMNRVLMVSKGLEILLFIRLWAQNF